MAQQAKPLEQVPFVTYHLQDFEFKDALEWVQTQLPNNPKFSLSHDMKQTLKKTFTNTTQQNKGKYIYGAPYIFSYCQGSNPIKYFGYYNYVLGYKQDAPTQLVLRVGYYDENKLKNVKVPTGSSASVQTKLGIKHIQLAVTDMNILFSGVMKLYENSSGQRFVRFSPMSGTWLDIMKTFIKTNQLSHTQMMTSLNYLNIICSSYAVYLASQPKTSTPLFKKRSRQTSQSQLQPQAKAIKVQTPSAQTVNDGPEVRHLLNSYAQVSTTDKPVVCKSLYPCKYPKKNGRSPENKYCVEEFFTLPRNLQIDLTCLTNPNEFECKHDIPGILNNLINPQTKSS